MFLPHPISKHSTDSSSLGRHSVINVYWQDHPYFTGKRKRGDDIFWWTELPRLDKGMKAGICCSRRSRLYKFSQNTHPSLCFGWQGLHFRHVGGKGWREKNALTMLFLSYLVRMAIFPSDILVPPKCHIPRAAVWTLSKARLWGERRRHMLIFVHAATADFFKSFVT